MPQLLDAHRDWWRRSFRQQSARTTAEPSGSRSTTAPPDSPLARARMAAEAARVAERLDALERSAATPEVVAALRSELIALRARLCRAARDVPIENVH